MYQIGENDKLNVCLEYHIKIEKRTRMTSLGKIFDDDLQDDAAASFKKLFFCSSTCPSPQESALVGVGSFV